MTPDVDWAGIMDYSPGSWRATTPQQMEFLASKAVAFGGAVSVEMAGGAEGTDGGVTTNGRALEAASRMGAWLKHNISFPPDVRHTQCGVNCFILDSRRVLAPAPKVLGPKHISNPDFAPF